MYKFELTGQLINKVGDVFHCHACQTEFTEKDGKCPKCGNIPLELRNKEKPSDA
jgi:rRNA maturation endonuclease Nob1